MSRTEPLAALDDDTRDRILAHRRQYEARRFATRPADRPDAERAMHTAYAAAGLAPPQRYLWCNDPVELARTVAALATEQATGASVKSAIVDVPLRRAAKHIDGGLARTVRAELWRLLSDGHPRSRAVTDVVEQAAAPTRPGLLVGLRRWRARIAAALTGTPPPPPIPRFRIIESTVSAHDRSPLAIYRCLHAMGIRPDATAHLEGLWQAVDAAGWIAPYERVCVLSERHTTLRFDTQGRLHADDGPALAFPGGWGIHLWKGVVIPAAFLDPQRPLAIEMIDRQRDPVLRRCMIDIMTPARFVREARAERISSDDTGTLWLKTWSDGDHWAAVEVVNGTTEPDGTYKHYFLQVPPAVRTAREAVAWTYGMSEREYAHLTLRT